mmetsp:Transcript_46265/g.128593  ORF Transcript_46265/g.128593 Transcript_46265/m.128593 type:complete len:239 (-) Transcript_46265:203-919(-)
MSPYSASSPAPVPIGSSPTRPVRVGSVSIGQCHCPVGGGGGDCSAVFPKRSSCHCQKTEAAPVPRERSGSALQRPRERHVRKARCWPLDSRDALHGQRTPRRQLQRTPQRQLRAESAGSARSRVLSLSRARTVNLGSRRTRCVGPVSAVLATCGKWKTIPVAELRTMMCDSSHGRHVAAAGAPAFPAPIWLLLATPLWPNRRSSKERSETVSPYSTVRVCSVPTSSASWKNSHCCPVA